MRSPGLVVAALSALLLTACSDSEAPDRTAVDYSSTLQAPSPSDFSSSEEAPDADDGIQRLTLDDGSEVVLWIDPADIASVRVQHSDPVDPDAWTAPRTIFEAGDGCLVMDAATNGEIVAVGLGCYESDAFVQQAPDQGTALVSTDLVTWDGAGDLGEFWSEPDVAADGEVTFVNGVYEDQAVLWSAQDGFSQRS